MLGSGSGRSKVMLTPIIAFFTRSFLISPSLERFSINSAFVVPEQYQAIDDCSLVNFLSSVVVFMCLFSIQKSPVRFERISQSDNHV